MAKLDYAIVTHMDADHINGLCDIIKGEEIAIQYLILPKLKNKDQDYKDLECLALEHNIKIIYMIRGDRFTTDNVMIHCFHPGKEEFADCNNASLTFSLQYKQFKMLFTGDIEEAGQNVLLNVLEKETYDVYKVAHHGSKNSANKIFLQHISPRISLISCGKNNPYGHPHEETLKALRNIDSKIYLTNISGAITIISNGESYQIQEWNNH